MNSSTQKMVRLAVLAALGVILLTLIRFPIIPSAPFLEYEPADVPILIAAFLYGPVSGLIVAVTVAFLQALTVSSASGWVGFIMHVISSGTLAVVAGLIYQRYHSYRGGVAGLILGTLAMTLIMIPANLFFTVNFWGIPADVVKSMIVPSIIPFNLIKGALNATLTILVYKPFAAIILQENSNPGGLARQKSNS
ncbi:MAG: ECF transporter S component [Bacillota bacterium]